MFSWKIKWLSLALLVTVLGSGAVIPFDRHTSVSAVSLLPVSTVGYLEMEGTGPSVSSNVSVIDRTALVEEVLGVGVPVTAKGRLTVAMVQVSGQVVPVAMMPRESDSIRNSVRNWRNVDGYLCAIPDSVDDSVAQLVLNRLGVGESLDLEDLIGSELRTKLGTSPVSMWVDSRRHLEDMQRWLSAAGVALPETGKVAALSDDGWVAAAAKYQKSQLDFEVTLQHSSAALSASSRHGLVRELPERTEFAVGVADLKASSDLSWMKPLKDNFEFESIDRIDGEAVIARSDSGEWGLVVSDSGDGAWAGVIASAGKTLFVRTVDGNVYVAQSERWLQELMKPRSRLGTSPAYSSVLGVAAREPAAVQVFDRFYESLDQERPAGLIIRTDGVRTHIVGGLYF